MSDKDLFCWPECFSKNTTDFSDNHVVSVLAVQLSAWGNLYMEIPAPNNFFEVMDAASKVTNVFTPDECRVLFKAIMAERRNSQRRDLE